MSLKPSPSTSRAFSLTDHGFTRLPRLTVHSIRNVTFLVLEAVLLLMLPKVLLPFLSAMLLLTILHFCLPKVSSLTKAF